MQVLPITNSLPKIRINKNLQISKSLSTDSRLTSFGSDDSFEVNNKTNAQNIAQNPDTNVNLSIDKSMFRHTIDGSFLNAPFSLKINKNNYSGEQNGSAFDFKVNEGYGGHAKSYEGNINGESFFLKNSNPWGSSILSGIFGEKPANLEIKVRADRSIINGNLGDNYIELEILTFMHRHKIEGKINGKKVDLNLNRNNIYGEYQDDNNLLPLLYALYNDRLLKDIKF